MFIFKLSLFINCKITYKYSQKGKILKLMHLNLKDLMGTNMYSKYPPSIPPPIHTHTNALHQNIFYINRNAFMPYSIKIILETKRKLIGITL